MSLIVALEEQMKTYKVIVDTDPGVDDANALFYLLNDPQFDVKLFTISNGNINIHNATRNMCHILDLLHKDIPVVEGISKRFGDNTEDATFLHGVEGLGQYTPPKKTTHQPLNMDCADATYEILKENPKQITMIILGPHTNFAHLILKHPDAPKLIKNIVMMGGAPNGTKMDPNHNSFNIRTDVPAFQYTLTTKLPVVMCPSTIGRDIGYFDERQVETLKNTNDIGKFFAKTFEKYWEPNYPEKIIATNDLCAIYYLTHPKLYKTYRCFMDVDEKGKTLPKKSWRGNFKVVTNLNRKKFIKMIFEKLNEMSNIKLDLNFEIPENITSEKPKKKIAKETKSKSQKQAKEPKPSSKKVSQKPTKVTKAKVEKSEKETKSASKTTSKEVKSKTKNSAKNTSKKSTKSNADVSQKPTKTTSKKSAKND